MKGRRENASFVSRQIGDRILLAVMAVPMGTLAIWGLILTLGESKSPRSFGPAIAAFAIRNFLFCLALVSILGLLWCFFTPQWVERMLERNAGKLMLALVVFIVASVIAVMTF